MFKLFFVIAGVLIAFGYLSIPITPYNMGRGSIWRDTINWAIAISPLLPVSIALINLVARGPLNKSLTMGFAILFAIGGTLISLLVAAVSGVGTSIVLIHGLSLTVAVSVSPLLLSAPPGLRALISGPFLALIGPMVVALWSLTSMIAIAWQANSLSENRPLCLALHSHDTDGIESFAELRGLSFYSTLSGLKSTSKWYFHGILIVDSAGKREVFNWSPRRMMFNKVEYPDRYTASPLNVCAPREDFLKTLTVW